MSIFLCKHLFLYAAWIPHHRYFHHVFETGAYPRTDMTGLNNQSYILDDPTLKKGKGLFKFSADDSNLRCSKDSFVRTMNLIYFGSERDQIEFIFLL